jgi:D-alanyl-lipoteichoic acid acyltransferase DltB (MBOAT superfamily)
VHQSLWTLRVILPVGISFYTFQALSYTIDVYRGQLHATRKFHEFLLAVPPPQPVWWHWVKVAAFFQLTALGWLIFRADSFGQLKTMLAALFHPSGVDLPLAWKIFSFALPLIVVQMIQYTTKTLDLVKWSWFTPEVSALAYSILLYFVLFRGGRPESFIYFQC